MPRLIPPQRNLTCYSLSASGRAAGQAGGQRSRDRSVTSIGGWVKNDQSLRNFSGVVYSLYSLFDKIRFLHSASRRHEENRRAHAAGCVSVTSGPPYSRPVTRTRTYRRPRDTAARRLPDCVPVLVGMPETSDARAHALRGTALTRCCLDRANGLRSAASGASACHPCRRP